jgi:hypothetical protein
MFSNKENKGREVMVIELFLAPPATSALYHATRITTKDQSIFRSQK